MLVNNPKFKPQVNVCVKARVPAVFSPESNVGNKPARSSGQHQLPTRAGIEQTIAATLAQVLVESISSPLVVPDPEEPIPPTLSCDKEPEPVGGRQVSQCQALVASAVTGSDGIFTGPAGVGRSQVSQSSRSTVVGGGIFLTTTPLNIIQYN